MHLVIPFASALSETAAQALATLSLPNLERVLAAWAPAPAPGTPPASAEVDEYSLSLPHERVLAALRGWPVIDGLLPFGAEAARADGLDVASGSGWGLLTPAHWLVSRDQITLVDPERLALDETESAALHAALRPLFEDIGWTLLRAAPMRWYVSHPSLADLPTASIDRAIGRNVDYWLNDHPGILAVRRLQSEVQMLLYVHPLNDERSARGELAVNSFWLSGTGAAPSTPAGAPAGVVVDDRLRAPALGDDWSAWADAWRALDAGPVRALAATADARLTLCGERLARTWVPAQRPWWKSLLGRRGAGAHATLAEL